jgi:hypothetical protein
MEHDKQVNIAAVVLVDVDGTGDSSTPSKSTNDECAMAAVMIDVADDIAWVKA